VDGESEVNAMLGQIGFRLAFVPLECARRFHEKKYT